MRIVWTPMGLESLTETTNFIAEQWNEQVVDLFIEQLKINPRIGPVYHQSRYRQLLIHPLVTLYYQLENDTINLVLIWANKQSPEELKKKLKGTR